MARIRTIKPEFWTSEQVVECSPIARLMFIGMWNFCDDNGNHPASYKTLKMEVFPGDEISIAEIECFTNELIKNGLLIEYDGGNGRRYWHVTGWNHQKIEKPNYRHPPFDPTKIEKFGDHSPTDRRPFADHSTPEGSLREGNSKGIGKEEHTPTTVPNSNQEPITPTPAACVCRELKNFGFSDLNPAHPLLLELLKAGSTIDEFVYAARTAKEKGKGFKYILGIVKSQRAEALAASKQVLHGEIKNKPPPRAPSKQEMAAIAARSFFKNTHEEKHEREVTGTAEFIEPKSPI